MVLWQYSGQKRGIKFLGSYVVSFLRCFAGKIETFSRDSCICQRLQGSDGNVRSSPFCMTGLHVGTSIYFDSHLYKSHQVKELNKTIFLLLPMYWWTHSSWKIWSYLVSHASYYIWAKTFKSVFFRRNRWDRTIVYIYRRQYEKIVCCNLVWVHTAYWGMREAEKLFVVFKIGYPLRCLCFLFRFLFSWLFVVGLWSWLWSLSPESLQNGKIAAVDRVVGC